MKIYVITNNESDSLIAVCDSFEQTEKILGENYTPQECCIDVYQIKGNKLVYEGVRYYSFGEWR